VGTGAAGTCSGGQRAWYPGELGRAAATRSGAAARRHCSTAPPACSRPRPRRQTNSIPL